VEVAVSGFLGVPWMGWVCVVVPNAWGAFVWWLIRRLSRERKPKTPPMETR